MRKPRRWFFLALCIGLAILAGFMRGGGGGLPYARVRLLSLCLHRGLSDKSVAWLLGHPYESTSDTWTSPGGKTGGTAQWLYGFDPGHPFPRHLSVDFDSPPGGPHIVTNWAWTDSP
jgi:hypothetical protein